MTPVTLQLAQSLNNRRSEHANVDGPLLPNPDFPPPRRAGQPSRMRDDDNTRGVLIGNGMSSIRLTHVGKGHEAGFPNLIEVKAGPFSGAVRDDPVGLRPFRVQLQSLHKSLTGEAKLGSYEKLNLVLSATPLGHVAVRVELYGEHWPRSKLEFEFEIDQSYLPSIIPDRQGISYGGLGTDAFHPLRRKQMSDLWREQMEIKAAQAECRQSYVEAGPGQIISGVLFLIAYLVNDRWGVRAAFGCLFFGGFLIFPLTFAIVRGALRRPPLSRENELGRLAVESAIGMMPGLFAAYVFLQVAPSLVFPMAAMAVGGHYFVFGSMFGRRVFWLLGAQLMAIGFFAMVGPFRMSTSTLLVASATELVFGIGLTAWALMQRLRRT
jgi:hypothetical protein